MKKVIAIAVLVGMCVAGFFGYQKHQASELMKNTIPTLKEATLRTKVVAGYLINPTNATFGEILDAGDTTVKKIGEMLITIESQNADANPAAIAASIDYLKASQMLARNVNAGMRIDMETNTIRKEKDRALADLKSDNEFTRKFARETLSKSIDSFSKQLEKMTKHAAEARYTISTLKTAYSEARKFFPDDALLPEETFKDLEDYFAEEESK